MAFLNKFQKGKNRQPRYRLCRNNYGYYKILKETWLVFPFVFWPIWTYGSYWCTVQKNSIRPGGPRGVLRFRSKREALDYIDNEKEKVKERNDNWSCEKKIR